jgi:hypothetical protein
MSENDFLDDGGNVTEVIFSQGSNKVRSKKIK